MEKTLSLTSFEEDFPCSKNAQDGRARRRRRYGVGIRPRLGPPARHPA